jgi:hypothetical protein
VHFLSTDSKVHYVPFPTFCPSDCHKFLVDWCDRCRLFGIVENVGEVALAAVLAVVHGSHEDTSTALLLRALSPQTLDLSIAVDLVVLENSQLGLLALVLDLFGCGIDLLLALLGHTTTEAEDEMESRLLLDVVVAQGAAIFELLAGEDQALLVWGNALLVCTCCVSCCWSGCQK